MRRPKIDSSSRKTFRMSRKIDAASSGAALMSWALRSRWKSYIVKPAKITRPEDRVDQLTVRDPDEDQDDPEDDQRDQREEHDARERRQVAPRRVAGSAEPGDEERGRGSRLVDRLRVGVRVVGDRRRDREAHQQTEPEQQADRELLGALDREAQAEQACDRGDEPEEAPARRVASQIGATREERGRDGDEAHGVGEEGARRVLLGDRARSVCRFGNAHLRGMVERPPAQAVVPRSVPGGSRRCGSSCVLRH